MVSEDARRDAVARFVDLTVFAPIGLLSLAREHLPELATTGRSRVQQQVTLARFVGEIAVRRGRREIERRLAGTADQRPGVPEAPLAAVVHLDVERQERASAPDHRPAAPPHDSLPIDGYESLAASQVVARLGSLATVELDAVEAFERAHRNRRTILGRIAQLRAGE